MGVVLILLVISAAYLVGSIPTAYLVARWKGIADIRTIGSGNSGATNVGRHLGVFYFFVTLLLDSAKAYLCLYWIASLGVSLTVMYGAALALMLGNGHSLFLNFTGGKGVATGIGILAYLLPQLLPVLIVSWLSILGWCKDVGVASVVSFWSSAGVLTILYYLDPSTTSYEFIILLVIMTSWITWRHRENLREYFNVRSNPSTGSQSTPKASTDTAGRTD